MAGQNPIGLNVQQAGSTSSVFQIGDSPTKLTTQPGIPVAGISGTSTALNLSASTVVKTGPGRVIRVVVQVAGAVGTLNDCLTTGAAAAANQICVVPATVGPVTLEFPFFVGLVYVPGAAQVAAVSFS